MMWAQFLRPKIKFWVRIRHVDTSYHFAREHVADNFIKIIFVRSEDNVADVFTKNIGKEMYERHVKTFLGKNDSHY
jgi:hypothetical protein